MNRSRTVAATAAGAIILFVYSGMMKWITVFPLDPTILFGGVVTVLFLFACRTGLPQLSVYGYLAAYATLAFFAWFLFTATYTHSDTYWQEKAIVLPLSILAFLAPIAIFRSEACFIYFERGLIVLGSLAAIFVLGFYLSGNVEFLLRQGFDKAATKIPNYLQLGSAIGVGVLVSLSAPSPLRIVGVAVGLFALLVLGARGPILFTGAMVVAGYYLYSGTDRYRMPGLFALVLPIALGAVALASWSGAERTAQRFAAMFLDTDSLAQGIRVSEFSVAADVIGQHPYFGVGLGGYGRVAYGADENEYPHNLFLEAFAEAGVIGLMLFTLSVFAIAAAALRGRGVRRMALYVVLALYYLLNYCKSGGFVGTRDIYLMFGVLVAYATLHPSPQRSSDHDAASTTGGKVGVEVR